MEMNVTQTVPFGRDEVFCGMRDHLPELVAFLPNVETIEVRSRTEVSQTKVEFVNRWQAAATEVPAVARPFIDPKKLFWLDYATWDTSSWRCHWRLEMGFMAERVACEGHTDYVAVGGKTEISLRGDLSLDLKGLLPGLIARKAKPAIENFVVHLIRPNMERVNDALVEYLKSCGSD